MSVLLGCDELIRYVNNYEMEYKMASIAMSDVINLMARDKCCDNLVIFDTRTSYKNGDWFGGHIKGAINTPSYKFKQNLSKLYSTYKHKKYIIIHCMYSQFRGPRSTKLYLEYLHTKQLLLSGKQYVYLLEGGFNNWLNECIKTNKMDLIEDYDSSKWEFIDDKYVHIAEHSETWDTISIISPPKIKSFKWGIVDIDYNGKIETFKDVILTPINVKEWNWELDGTRHKPGITVKAIEINKLLEESDYVILTKGVKEALHTKQDTIKYLEKAKEDGEIKDYFILQSNKAVAQYTNMVQNGQKVSGLFHSTC